MIMHTNMIEMIYVDDIMYNLNNTGVSRTVNLIYCGLVFVLYNTISAWSRCSQIG